MYSSIHSFLHLKCIICIKFFISLGGWSVQDHTCPAEITLWFPQGCPGAHMLRCVRCQLESKVHQCLRRAGHPVRGRTCPNFECFRHSRLELHHMYWWSLHCKSNVFKGRISIKNMLTITVVRIRSNHESWLRFMHKCNVPITVFPNVLQFDVHYRRDTGSPDEMFCWS